MKRMRRWITMILLVMLGLAGCAPFSRSVVSSPTTTGSACPSWTNPPAPVNVPAPTQQSTYALAQYTAQLVLQTPRPILNRYTTTVSPINHLDNPIPCLVRTTARNEQVGHSQKFWIVDSDTGDQNLVSARLVYETPHLYMYVEDGANVSLAGIEASADRFERQSFPTDERTFGHHWSPGVDDDPHITVLNATGLGKYIGGYFSPQDEFPRAVYSYSNERQMIYVNLDGGETPGDEFYDSTLAHEFQHMIHWYLHPGDDSWVDEGMSVLAQHINGYTTANLEDDFLANPGTQLTSWASSPDPVVRAHYGAGYLFMDYFAEHYGGYSVLKELLSDPAQTPLNFDSVLAAHGYKDRFDDVFAKFVIANLLNDSNAAGGIYAYPGIPSKQVQPQHTVVAYPFGDGSPGHPAIVAQYATQYYDFRPTGSGPQTLAITFAGNPYIPIVNNQPYGGAANEWWSNSGKSLDSTLTHTFDLTGLVGRHVSFNFHSWYDLGSAIAYVEISADGGQNWDLPTVYVDNGRSDYCCGLTATSGGSTTPQWEADSVDLSPYAGKTIQIRFEIIANDSIHAPGLTLDDIEIPQLGFKDNVSTGNGWQAAGFIRSPNILPERYVLQAVIYSATKGTEVQPVSVDPQTGRASVTFAGFGDGTDHLVLVVSAMTPSVWTPAQYLLSAQLQ